MAIKGKKKNRGSSPRRPAGAPRPAVSGARRHTPFYRTRDGLFIIAIFVAVAIGVVVWLVTDAQSKARERDERRQVLEQYTDQVGPVLGSVTEAVEQMAALQTLPTGSDLDDAVGEAEGWQTAFQEAQIQLTQVFPSTEVQGVNQLFNEAFALYGNATGLFVELNELDLTPRERAGLFSNFAVQRDLATAVIESAIGAFDALRSELDMGASRLRAPVSSQPPQQEDPSQSEVIIPEEGAEDGAGTGDGEEQPAEEGSDE